MELIQQPVQHLRKDRKLETEGIIKNSEGATRMLSVYWNTYKSNEGFPVGGKSAAPRLSL